MVFFFLLMNPFNMRPEMEKRTSVQAMLVKFFQHFGYYL